MNDLSVCDRIADREKIQPEGRGKGGGRCAGCETKVVDVQKWRISGSAVPVCYVAQPWIYYHSYVCCSIVFRSYIVSTHPN